MTLRDIASTPEAVAHHEAAHACVALALGYSPSRASIRPCCDECTQTVGETFCLFLNFDKPHLNKPDAFSAFVAYAMAGGIRLAKYLADRGDEVDADTIADCTKGDIRRIEEDLASVNLLWNSLKILKPDADTIPLAALEANRLLIANWHKVEALANALLEHGHLDSAQIEKAAA